MPIEYVVRQGDCISSIAAEHGFLPDTIWNHFSNAALKKQRKDPNILMRGDVVVIPDKTLRYEERPTDARHVFVRRGVPEKLQLVLLDDTGFPRPNVPYTTIIDGKLHEGSTDGEGRLVLSIPPNAKEGRLIVREGEEEYPLDLGHLDPVTEISGVQARLSNLGLDCGSEDGELCEKTVSAIRRFQESVGLEPTGELDDETRRDLLKAHGS